MILQHRAHHLARALAVAAVAIALTAPPAIARIDPPATTAFDSRDDVPANPPVVVRTIDDGFDWGAAAIGAGGAGLLIALAAFANISRDRTRVALRNRQ